MFIIQYLPDFVSHLIVLLGVSGLVCTFLPIVWRLVPSGELARRPVQILSMLVLCFGMYLEGGLAEQSVWKLKVSELESKLAVAQQKSGKVNVKIVTEYVDRVKIIKQKGDTITKFIDREVVKYDKTCPIPKVVISTHNAAAKNDVSLLVPSEPASSPIIKLAPRK